MQITPKHIKIAKLLIEKNLATDKIGVEAGITGRQIRRWMAEPQYKPFQELVEELLEKRIIQARLMAKSYATKSINRLYDLSQNDKDPETARKATNDLLQIAGLVKDQEGQSTNPIVQIFNNIPGVLAQVQAQEKKENGDIENRF